MISFKLHRPIHEDRPWGCFDLFTHNDLYTLKIITVSPGESTSLQLHQLREETWIVISGTGIIHIGDKQYEVKKYDSFTIPHNITHRLTATAQPLVIIEVATGKFEEEDIVRLKDKYGRSDKS